MSHSRTFISVCLATALVTGLGGACRPSRTGSGGSGKPIANDNQAPVSNDNEESTNDNQGPSGLAPLEYVDFMTGSRDTIAGTLAEALGVGPVTFSQEVTPGEVPVGMVGDIGVDKGYDYATASAARITVWVDEDDQPYAATYLLRRLSWLGQSADWSYGEENAGQRISSITQELGMEPDGSEDLSVKSQTGIAGEGRHPHWFYVELAQTFRKNALEYPMIIAELEGSSGQVCFLSVCRWYTNLNDITDILSDDELAAAAIHYYEQSGQVIEVPDSVDAEGWYIVRDRLCKLLGSARIDEWGSSLHVYVDVQTGEVVDESPLYVG